MFGEFNNQIREVIDLSVFREQLFRDEVKQGLHEGTFLDLGDCLEGEKHESGKIETNIKSILETIDEEILLKLKTVMYLGRDYDSSEGLSPTEAYEMLLKSFSEDAEDKEVIIYTLLSKTSLGSYLTTGFELLKMHF